MQWKFSIANFRVLATEIEQQMKSKKSKADDQADNKIGVDIEEFKTEFGNADIDQKM